MIRNFKDFLRQIEYQMRIHNPFLNDERTELQPDYLQRVFAIWNNAHYHHFNGIEDWLERHPETFRRAYPTIEKAQAVQMDAFASNFLSTRTRGKQLTHEWMTDFLNYMGVPSNRRTD